LRHWALLLPVPNSRPELSQKGQLLQDKIEPQVSRAATYLLKGRSTLSSQFTSIAEELIATIRRITRSTDLYSRALFHSHGLTAPQATMLKALAAGPLIAGDLAQKINLSQGTVTDILTRLEGRGMLVRNRGEKDRRRVMVELTEKSREFLTNSLPLVQESFAAQFTGLPEWEQNQILSAMQRVAHMMEKELPKETVYDLKTDIASQLLGPVGGLVEEG